MMSLRTLPTSRSSSMAGQPCLRSKAAARPLQTATRPRVCICNAAVTPDALRAAKKDIVELLSSVQANPILVRLGWHDSGTYDESITEWPTHGGAIGSIRFLPELDHDANAGLVTAINLMKPIQKKNPDVGYADLYQLASATAIQMAGGPVIPMRYNRKDAQGPEDCSPEGRLPAAKGPFPDEAPTPAQHLRNVFHRMGLNDKDIVALSGAHTLGRAFKDRSGMGAGKEGTAYTKDAKGTKGGTSWTPEWLKFDNSYFVEIKEKRDAELLVMPTDEALFEDPSFAEHAELFAKDQDAFFKAYAESHAKLSELGSQFLDDKPVTFKDDPLEAYCSDVPDADECRVYED